MAKPEKTDKVVVPREIRTVLARAKFANEFLKTLRQEKTPEAFQAYASEIRSLLADIQRVK